MGVPRPAEKHREVGDSSWSGLARTAAAVLALAATLAAGDFAGLRPGKSTSADAERALGAVLEPGPPMRFAGDRWAASSILVDCDPTSGVVRSIAIRPLDPPTLADATAWFALGDPDASEACPGGEMRTYAPQRMRLVMRGDRVVELVHVAPVVLRAAGDLLLQEAIRRHDRAGIERALSSLRTVSPGDPEPLVAAAQALFLDFADDETALALVEKALVVSPGHEAASLWKTLLSASMTLRPAGWLGIHLLGDQVATVFEGTPAAAAGMREGDRIVEVDGHAVQKPPPTNFPNPQTSATYALRRLLDVLVAGKEVAIGIRRGEEALSLRLTPIDREAYFDSRGAAATATERAVVLAERYGPIDLAQAFLRGAVEDEPGDRARCEFAQATECDSYEEGRAAWRSFLDAAGPSTPIAWRALAGEELARLERGLEGFRRGCETYDAGKDPAAAARALWEVGPVDCAQVYYALGLCLRAQARPLEAARCFFAARELLPGHDKALEFLSECVETWDLPRAHAWCVQRLRCAGGAELDAAEVSKLADRRARLQAAYARALLARRLSKRGMWAQAEEELEAASAACPTCVWLLGERLPVLSSLGRRDEAVRLGEAALAMSEVPATQDVRRWLGQEALHADRLDRAIDLLGRAAVLAPKDEAIQRLLGRARARREWQGANDGGFETGLVSPWEPWRQNGGCDATATVDRTCFASGAASLHIVNRTAQQAQVYGTIAQPVTLVAGHRYRIQLWAAARGLASRLSVGVSVDKEWRVRPIALRKGTYPWTLFTGTFTAVSDAGEIRIISEDVGEAWIDDVLLVEDEGGAK